MKILLAMDTSPASTAALDEIVARQWPAGSSFEVLSVGEPSHLWTTSEVPQEAARRAEEVVQSGAAQLRSKGHEVAGTVLSGDPKAVILDQARSWGADFIVVGSHGGSAITRLILGNVAANVLRYAPCSVEIVRGRLNLGRTRVLLATDGSASSERAARSIAERPWPASTAFRVLSAVELILPPTRALMEPPFVDSAFIESARGEAMQRSQDAIARAMETLAATGGDLSESISVLLDTPRAIILEEANRWGADLIVLGSHGHSGVERFLLGSVSEGVALHATCSVEIIRG